jgi:hypothetical protein
MEPEPDPHTPVTPALSLGLKEQWTYVLLAGCLSMLYAELFSGASRIWFLDPWSLLVTFPLYMVHLLFFFNIALRTHKTSPVHLYLWGVLFGMYESWLTQVLWVGYQGAEGPMIGTLLGIGIGEFLALVFFWHPILSFVLPLIIFQLFVISQPSELPLAQRVLPSHIPFLAKTKSNQRYLVFLYVIGSVFIALNYEGNFIVVIAALGGTYSLIYLLFRKACTYTHFSVYSLRVKDTGMKIIVIYLLLLYTLLFVGFGYYGGRIPGYLPVITTIILYGVFSWIIHTYQPAAESAVPPRTQCIPLKDYKHLVYFNLLVASGMCFVFLAAPVLLMLAFLCFYGFMCIAGIYLFCKVLNMRTAQPAAG